MLWMRISNKILLQLVDGVFDGLVGLFYLFFQLLIRLV